MRGLPLLEELELSLCDKVAGGNEVFEFVGLVCPQLKHFRLNKSLFDYTEWNKDMDALGIASMHGLHSLQLFSNHLTHNGLETILNCCPHLEALDIRHCFNINMGETTLLLKCAKIKALRLPDDTIDDYEHEVQSPIKAYIPQQTEDWYTDFGSTSHYDSDFTWDWGDSDFDVNELDFYDEPSRYEDDLDKYEKVLPFSMRTFLK